MIVLVRHFRTIGNLANILQGCNTNLPVYRGDVTRYGNALRDYVRRMEPSHVYSSPIERALYTARYVLDNNILLNISPDLREIDYGAAEGLLKEDYYTANTKFAHTYEIDRMKTRWPEGESYEDVYKRIEQFIFKELKVKRNKTCVIFTHMVVIRMFLYHFGVPERTAVHASLTPGMVFEINTGRGAIVRHNFVQDSDYLYWSIR